VWVSDAVQLGRHFASPARGASVDRESPQTVKLCHTIHKQRCHFNTWPAHTKIKFAYFCMFIRNETETMLYLLQINLKPFFHTSTGAIQAHYMM